MPKTQLKTTQLGTTGLEVAVDLIYGPLYHRLLHGHAPLSGRFAEDVVDMALAGIVNPSSQAGA